MNHIDRLLKELRTMPTGNTGMFVVTFADGTKQVMSVYQVTGLTGAAIKSITPMWEDEDGLFTAIVAAVM